MMNANKNDMYIPYYLNKYGERVPMSDANDIKKWNEINNRLCKLDGDTWLTYMDAISDYVWNYETSKTSKLYNRVYRIGKKLGFTVKELEMWYCCEQQANQYNEQKGKGTMKYYYIETWEKVADGWNRQFLFTATDKTIDEIHINESTKIEIISFKKYLILTFLRLGNFKQYKRFLKGY